MEFSQKRIKVKSKGFSGPLSENPNLLHGICAGFFLPLADLSMPEVVICLRLDTRWVTTHEEYSRIAHAALLLK
jgi:hypothetical protein